MEAFNFKNKIIILTLFSLVLIFISGCTSCPESCDDGNSCTNNYCSEETNYQCVTEDIIPCLGNNICEEGEYGTADCPDCDDGNKCTNNYINYETLECITEEIAPCCGNNIVETGETCSSCPEDVICLENEICCDDKCIKPVCISDSDCDDGKAFTVGICLNSGKCNSKCEFQYTTECKKDGYCPDNCDYTNDEDCLYKKLDDIKYDEKDIQAVRELAKKYRNDLSDFSSNYKVGEIPAELQDLYSYLLMNPRPDEIPTIKTPIEVFVFTPFYEAVKTFSEYDKIYKEYTDKEIIDILSKDQIHVAMIWYGESGMTKGSDFKNLGEFHNIALKTNEKTHSSLSSDYTWTNFRIKAKKFDNYNIYNNQQVTIIAIGTKGERELKINLNNYR